MDDAFGRWLKAAIKAAGLKQTSFADLMGVRQSTVSRWCNGGDVTLGQLARMVEVLGMSEVAVLRAARGAPAPIEARLIGPRRGPSPLVLPDRPLLIGTEGYMLDAVPTKPVPVFELRFAADGRGPAYPDGEGGMPAEMLFVPVARLRHPASYVVGLKVSGDCMEPGLERGSTIIVEATDDWRAGDIVVALVDDALQVKRIERNGGGWQLVGDDGQSRLTVDDRVTIKGVVLGRFIWNDGRG